MIVRINTLFETPTLSVMDYRCSAAPGDKPYVELFAAHSISYVRAVLAIVRAAASMNWSRARCW
jgi:hypothetical protein